MESKSPKPFHLKLIRQRAERILKDHGIFDLPVNPSDLADKNGIIVKAKPDTVEGVSGMLVRSGDQFGIMYATHFHNEGFERFSIAHELGHYFLDGHAQAIFKHGDIHESVAGFVSKNRLEREADVFAASLLMPEDLFRGAILDYEIGLDAIRSLADLCKTSLTATAIRYAELVTQAVGIVITTGGKVDFSFFSSSMKKVYGDRKPKRGEPLPPKTPTAHMWTNPSLVSEGRSFAREIDIGLWSDSAPDIDILEETIGLGRYGKALTVLSCELKDEELDDEDRQIEESWRPRFSK